MTFQAHKLSMNLYSLMRAIGYRPLGTTARGELNCVRPLGADYPRFHIYAKEEGGVVTFNIHLDQKKPSYEGAHAHSGDYESDVVREEVVRIQDIALED